MRGWTIAAAVTVLVIFAGCMERRGSNGLGYDSLKESRPVEYDRGAKNRAGLRRSDLCMRVLNGKVGPKSKEWAWETWRPDRLEWTYANDPNFIRMVHADGGTYAGAIAAGTTDPNRALLQFDGEPQPAHGRFRGCMNRAAFFEQQKELLMKWEAFGVDSIQHDECLTNFTAYQYRWATCFCPSCTAGFARYCAAQGVALPEGVQSWEGFSYHDYLSEQQGVQGNADYIERRDSLPLQREFERYMAVAARRYVQDMIGAWTEARGKRPVFSINMLSEMRGTFGVSRCPILDQLDYVIGETNISNKSAAEWVHVLRVADALNLPQISVIKKVGAYPTTSEARRAMALVYAMGHRVLLPWDVYIHDAPRWYADYEDYADIVEFIRGHRYLFDGYEAYQDVLVLVPLEREAYEPGLIALTAELQRRGILCGYSLCGSDRYGFVHVPVMTGELVGPEAVYLAGSWSDFDEGDRMKVEKAIAKGGVNYRGRLEMSAAVAAGVDDGSAQLRTDMGITDAAAGVEAGPDSHQTLGVLLAGQMDAEALPRTFEVAGEGAEEIMVLPRVYKDARGRRADDKPVIVHVVNTGEPKKGISVRLSNRLLGSKAPKSVSYYAPGEVERPAGFILTGDSITVPVGELREWAVLSLK